MLAKVCTCAVIGLDGAVVEVEVDVSAGLPSFTIVGLPDAAVQESRERVRAAVKNSGFSFPLKRIVANLAPANLKKAGPAYDLPIAIALLVCIGEIKADLSRTIFLGELSLDGSLRHTSGVLPMVATAEKEGYQQVIVPHMDGKEATLVENIEVLPCQSLAHIVALFQGKVMVTPLKGSPVYEVTEDESYPPITLDDIKGQEYAKRALEVAAAGGHNMIMNGPPGSGKTLLAQALASILPPLTKEEAIEVTKIYSISGLLPPESPIIKRRPFRSPHYTISYAGLAGGGQWPKPGEITLAHRGVLFLDELPEFSQSVLEILRQPIEDKAITISRASGSITFPANFMLIGAMNPCPCGYYGDPYKECRCSPGEIARYQKRISGPFLDRIDIFIDVPRVDYEKLTAKRGGETTRSIREEVIRARNRQGARFADTTLLCNADMGPADIERFCPLNEDTQSLLKVAMERLHLSARAFHRIIKLSRTIADLEGSASIEVSHVAEAIQYRSRTLNSEV